MPEAGDAPTGLPVTAKAAAPVSFSAMSPPQQGDAISGVTLAVAGVGDAGAASLPVEVPGGISPADAWAVAADGETGWYVLCSQDCDLVANAGDEPTVIVAPLILVYEQRWHDLNQNAYSSRFHAYPGEKFHLPDGKRLAVDLAWSTAVLKGSLQVPTVQAVRPLTGPQAQDFAEWLGARFGRVPFPDDVVTAVLDPCYAVRKRLLSSHRKALDNNTTAKLEARAVGAVRRWYAQSDGRNVMIVGELHGARLAECGLIHDDGTPDTEAIKSAEAKITAQIATQMHKAVPNSGFNAKVRIVDLNEVPAAHFRAFALLMR